MKQLLRRIFPRSAAEGYDAAFTARFYRMVGPVLAAIFRLQVTGTENLRTPGILASNHNAGLWGILDVLLLYHAFHNLRANPGILSAMSEETVFKVPVLGPVAAKTGLKIPNPGVLGDCLDSGHWVYITPGANTDQLRPIWMKNRARFQKAVFVNGRRVFRDQTWYLDAALARGAPVYPVSISGTHEMTPILWESPAILRWSGLERLRRDEHWPGFPITLNHFINAAILAATPLRSAWWAWLVFAALHVYVDFLYSYPLFPFQVKIHFGEPLPAGRYEDGMRLGEKQARQQKLHDDLVSKVNASLTRLDSERWWVRLFGGRR